MQGSHRLPRGLATRMAVVFTFAFAALALTAPSTGATIAGQNGAVYFTRANEDSGATDIYAARPDGSIVQVTSSGAADDAAVGPLSLDKPLAYDGTFDSGSGVAEGQIFQANANGTEAAQVTAREGRCCTNAQDPSFEPAFTVSPGGLVVSAEPIPNLESTFTLFVGQSGSFGIARQLTGIEPNNHFVDPEWSGNPDDGTIVFATSHTGMVETATLLGGPPTPLVAGSHPSFSPDGSRIAFQETRSDGTPAIDTIAANGSDRHDILPFGSEPSYAPDGTRVAFARAETPPRVQQGIWSARASDGRKLALVTEAPAGYLDRNPYWSSATLPVASCRGHAATLTGTAHGDTLAGAGARDVISAGHGVDKVGGRRGPDLLCAGRGHDVLRGGAGNDTLIDTRGRSHVDCGAGKHDVAITTRRSKVNDCEKVIRR
jgi:Ca2+-binding RTX toxin-like protein